MFKNMVEWRKENQIDSILERFLFEQINVKRLDKYLKWGYHGVDKVGRPVYLERAGSIDADAILREVTAEFCQDLKIYIHEVRD